MTFASSHSSKTSCSRSFPTFTFIISENHMVSNPSTNKSNNMQGNLPRTRHTKKPTRETTSKLSIFNILHLQGFYKFHPPNPSQKMERFNQSFSIVSRLLEEEEKKRKKKNNSNNQQPTTKQDKIRHLPSPWNCCQHVSPRKTFMYSTSCFYAFNAWDLILLSCTHVSPREFSGLSISDSSLKSLMRFGLLFTICSICASTPV